MFAITEPQEVLNCAVCTESCRSWSW